MRECIFVLGTRAQLVKVAPVLNQAVRSRLRHVVWFTGQHHESIDDLIDDFRIESVFVLPDRRMERSSILRLVTWFPGTFLNCYQFIKKVRDETRTTPLVIVHGDTLSTWLGAAAGRLAGSRIVHLESGLSSGRIADPFPEELLRRLTFRLTDYALCPNDEAFERMRAFNGCEVVHTGENTLLDCVRDVIISGVSTQSENLSGYFVVSIHRFQNIYRKSTLHRVVDEVIELSSIGHVHFILHPPTEQRLKKYKLIERLRAVTGVILQPRMPYTDFVTLAAGARGVITDGGSNQEELSYLGVPTVLFRNRSERPDGLGKNVVLFRQDIISLVEFIRSGKLDALRELPKLDAQARPSRISVDAIQRWAA